MEETVYKKFYRKADKHLNDKIKAHHGKREHQKLKPVLIFQYLLRCTDENHTASAYDIQGFLLEYGIITDRRSVYRDIDEINKMALLFNDDYDFDDGCEFDEDYVVEAKRKVKKVIKMLKEDECDELKVVVYDKHSKGFYVKQRKFELDDIRLLAECVYTAKFVSESKARQLIDVVCELVSEHQAENLRHDAFMVDRARTANKNVFTNVITINDAMSYRNGDDAHEPEKISFKYSTYSLDNLNQQTERRKGERYVVSPYKLLINDGNYYLLAFDDKKKKLWTYRVDRMKDIRYTGEPRDGEEEFKKIDLATYTRRAFNMYSGEEKRITLRFINPLLDTVIERFGTKDAQYSRCDDSHFTVTAKVEISNQFFGWLLGFGKKAKLISPDDVVEKFKSYVEDVKKMYE